MKSITDLFSKYANIEPPARAQKDAVVKALKDVLDVDISRDAVEITKGVAFLSVPSVLKQEIRFHEQEIIERTNAHIGARKGRIATIR